MIFLPYVIKNFLKETCCYGLFVHYRHKKELANWIKRGREGPAPHLIKQIALKEYAKRFNIHIFIETGTYMGDMVKAMQDEFDQIISIELSHELFKKAKKKFSGKSNITIYEGDSAEILPEILSSISQPAIFWLDGHFSGGNTAKAGYETPVKRELDCILNHYIKDHIILIDDARCFNGESDYPTLKELNDLILKERPNAHIELKHDIIRIKNRDRE